MKTNSAVDFKLLAKRSYLYDKAFHVKEISSKNTQHENIIYTMQAPFYIASHQLYQKSDFLFLFLFFFRESFSHPFDFDANFL